mmetsp:Transcript_45108/g.145180  ORF Transcript_45108/g.145180 Transcript_45108/m.145180 type:complete len:258 (+) Transcript_45108:87-860(+)
MERSMACPSQTSRALTFPRRSPATARSGRKAVNLAPAQELLLPILDGELERAVLHQPRAAHPHAAVRLARRVARLEAELRVLQHLKARHRRVAVAHVVDAALVHVPPPAVDKVPEALEPRDLCRVPRLRVEDAPLCAAREGLPIVGHRSELPQASQLAGHRSRLVARGWQRRPLNLAGQPKVGGRRGRGHEHVEGKDGYGGGLLSGQCHLQGERKPSWVVARPTSLPVASHRLRVGLRVCGVPRVGVQARRRCGIER